jgi:hypothetical protein
VAFIQEWAWEFTLHTGVQSVLLFLMLVSIRRQVTDLPMRRLVIGYFRVDPICKYRNYNLNTQSETMLFRG